MMEESQEIPCPICRTANPDFEAITRKINQARTPAGKTPFAQELIQKVGTVLNEHQTSGNVLTEACRTILGLRKQTAELIIKFRQ
ncbi:MAG: hypothetical protein HYZ89_01340 [Candidatus Omnitrophica bacterium]|nr:hypothetical protein [Candidatus Omnitrophota bacterium]